MRSFMANTLRKMSNEIVHAATVFVVRSGNNARLIHAAFHRGKRWCQIEHRLGADAACDGVRYTEHRKRLHSFVARAALHL
jgi:hypothetical protein